MTHKHALKNQHRPTRQCECGRGTVYTDNRPGAPRLDGKLVCEECFLDSIYAKYGKKD
jgi:hypothetical protein